jgi:hypothetical protein
MVSSAIAGAAANMAAAATRHSLLAIIFSSREISAQQIADRRAH